MGNKKDWRTQKLVEEFIDNIIILPIEAFYPTALLKYDSSLNMENVWNILLEQCQLKKISLKWEVLCTSNDNPSCFRSAGIQEDVDPLNGEIQCDLCGDAYEIKQENILPIFVVNEDYQKFMQERLKKKPKLSEIIDESSVRKAIIASSDTNNLLSMKDLVASGLQINYFGEVVHMINDKTVNVIKDSSFGHNTNIQSDHNTQSVDVINDPFKGSFDELFKQIRKLEHLEEQDNALEDAKGARKAMAQNNKERAKKLLSMLPDAIKTTSAFISIYNVVNTNK